MFPVKSLFLSHTGFLKRIKMAETADPFKVIHKDNAKEDWGDTIAMFQVTWILLRFSLQ